MVQKLNMSCWKNTINVSCTSLTYSRQGISSISGSSKTGYSINLQVLGSSDISTSFKLQLLVECRLLVPREDEAHCLESGWACRGVVNQTRPVPRRCATQLLSYSKLHRSFGTVITAIIPKIFLCPLSLRGQKSFTLTKMN